MRHLIIGGLLSISTLTIKAQSEFNLVPNPSFEEMEGKLKAGGAIELASPWESVTMNPVDLYSGEAKSDEYSVPENKYGKEKARTGINYAGVSFYGYRGKMPRTYLGTELIKPMEAGKEYCLKFHVSLSDMSKYAVNNLGMYVAKERISEATDGNLSFEPQMMSVMNGVFEKQFLWTAICGTYVAEGGEKYIIIGNFKNDTETAQETIRLSREFSGRQSYDAYYFVDDVSVIPTDKLDKKGCACDKIAGGQMEVEFKKFGTDESLKQTAKKTYLVNSDGSKAGEEPIEEEKEEEEVEEVESEGTIYKKFGSSTEEEQEEEGKAYNPSEVVIYFDSKSFEPKASETSKIEELANYLQENTAVKIQIEGHSDPSEASVKFLGKRRGFMMQKQLLDLGVSADQLKYVGKEAESPASKTEAAKNQRVTITVQ